VLTTGPGSGRSSDGRRGKRFSPAPEQSSSLGGTIGIRSIAVAPAWRHRGLGRTLLDSLAGRAGASMVVAETDDDAVGFYRRCGFAIEDAPPKFGRPRYWCVHEISR